MRHTSIFNPQGNFIEQGRLDLLEGKEIVFIQDSGRLKGKVISTGYDYIKVKFSNNIIGEIPLFENAQLRFPFFFDKDILIFTAFDSLILEEIHRNQQRFCDILSPKTKTKAEIIRRYLELSKGRIVSVSEIVEKTGLNVSAGVILEISRKTYGRNGEEELISIAPGWIFYGSKHFFGQQLLGGGLGKIYGDIGKKIEQGVILSTSDYPKNKLLKIIERIHNIFCKYGIKSRIKGVGSGKYKLEHN